MSRTTISTFTLMKIFPDQETIHRAIHQNIETGSVLHTDEFASYRGLDGLFFGHEDLPASLRAIRAVGITLTVVLMLIRLSHTGARG